MSKPRRHQKQVDAAILDGWSANKTPSDKAARPLAGHVSRTGMQIYPRAPSNPGHRGFHRSPRSVPGSVLAVCDSLGFLLAVALGLDVSYCVASHFLSDLRDRGDRKCRCCLLPAHLEPYLVAGRRGGSSYRLGLEFRDVLRLHLAPALVLKSHDGGWRSLAETAYL
jgi:hypothetical protein